MTRLLKFKNKQIELNAIANNASQSELTCKLIAWPDRYEVKELLNLRTNVMASQGNTVSEKFYDFLIDKEEYFYKSLLFGLYMDNKLDCFAHYYPWTDMPHSYSVTLVGTRKRNNRIKLPNGYDLNYTVLQNYRTNYMEEHNYFWLYTQRSDEPNWRPFEDNVYNKLHYYSIDVMENIPANEKSKYEIFRKNFLSAVHPIKTMIISHYCPLELRKEK